MTLDEEITELTQRWYKYVGRGHHKGRDCHFYIEKVWSYGDPPTYHASHFGYRAEHWESPKCATAQAATVCLRDFLKAEIDGNVKHLRDVLENYDPNNAWDSEEELRAQLDILTKGGTV